MRKDLALLRSVIHTQLTAESFLCGDWLIVQDCIPWDLQEYFELPMAGVPGSWQFWNLGIGSTASGASFHVHARALNLLTVGTKRWFLHAPAAAAYSTKPMFDWLRDDFEGPVLHHAGASSPAQERRPEVASQVEFLQHAGDIVVLPKWVGHATVCLGDCVSLSHVKTTTRGATIGTNPPGPFEDSLFSAAEHANLLQNEARMLPLVNDKYF